MNWFDIGASVVVVCCIGLAFKYRWLWLLYAFSCLTIAIVDYNINLYGQAVMNFIVFGLAIKNFFISNKTKKEKQNGHSERDSGVTD